MLPRKTPGMPSGMPSVSFANIVLFSVYLYFNYLSFSLSLSKFFLVISLRLRSRLFALFKIVVKIVQNKLLKVAFCWIKWIHKI